MDRKPPFLIDYLHEGRRFAFMLLGPESWAEAEAHLASIRANALVEGSDVALIPVEAVAALAETVLAQLSKAGRAAELMDAGAAILAAASVQARGGTGDAEQLAVALLREASF